MSTIEKRGYLNVRKLLDDKKIQLNEIPFTTEWISHEEIDLIFTGQIENNMPKGYVIVINSNGMIHEGLYNENFRANGFGRFVSSDKYYFCGWWRNGSLNGNAYFIDNERHTKEGWFREGKLVE